MRLRWTKQRLLIDFTRYLSSGSCMTVRWGQVEMKLFFWCDGPYSSKLNVFDFISGFGYKVWGLTWRFLIVTWVARYKERTC